MALADGHGDVRVCEVSLSMDRFAVRRLSVDVGKADVAPAHVARPLVRLTLPLRTLPVPL